MKFLRALFSDKPKAPAREFRVPDGARVYAIGDVHGRADLLQRLLRIIVEDMEARPGADSVKLVFLGDYVDRGYHSKEVIETLLKLDIAGVGMVFLAGNHEDMMLQFFDDPAVSDLWLKTGGVATLASYGVMLPDNPDIDALTEASNALAEKMPVEHRKFLESLEEHYVFGDYLFVHAGLRPHIPLTAQRRSDKLGIRREFTDSDFAFEHMVVHGHTGVQNPLHLSNRIAVDTGAFATGHLTAAVIEAGDVTFLST